jgi:hypothetical protein
MTKKRKDILLDDEFNMQANGRDILIGGSDAQHVTFLLISPKNSFKEFPSACVGLEAWRKKPYSSVNSMRREIKVQLKSDGYKVLDFELDKTGETILNYENDY